MYLKQKPEVWMKDLGQENCVAWVRYFILSLYFPLDLQEKFPSFMASNNNSLLHYLNVDIQNLISIEIHFTYLLHPFTGLFQELESGDKATQLKVSFYSQLVINLLTKKESYSRVESLLAVVSEHWLQGCFL